MVYVKYALENNAQGQFLSSISDSTTTITLKASEWDLFPDTYPYVLTLEKLDGNGDVTSMEMVKVTNKSSDTFTVERGFGDTTGTAFDADDYVSLYVVKEIIEDVQDEVTRLETDKLDVDGELRTGLGAWKTIYTDASGDETQIALGASGKFLRSNWTSSAPTWENVGLDINALTEDATNPVTNDMIAWYKNWDSTEYKRNALSTTSHFWLARMQTDAEALAGTSEEWYINAKQAKDNYAMLVNVVTGSRTVGAWTGSETIAHWLARTPKFVVAIYDNGSTSGIGFYGDSIASAMYNANSWQGRSSELINLNGNLDATVTGLDDTNLTVTWSGSASNQTDYTLWFIG